MSLRRRALDGEESRLPLFGDDHSTDAITQPVRSEEIRVERVAVHRLLVERHIVEKQIAGLTADERRNARVERRKVIEIFELVRRRHAERVKFAELQALS